MMNTSSSCLINRFLALKAKASCSESSNTTQQELLQLADDAITALVKNELALDEFLSPPKDFAFKGDEGIK